MAGSSKEKPTLGTVTTCNSCLLALLRLAVQHLVCRLKHYALLVRAPVITSGKSYSYVFVHVAAHGTSMLKGCMCECAAPD